MKAFLSHSSQNKDIVERVAKRLGDAKVVIDKRHFEFGELTSTIIEEKVKSCNLFVLFLSREALLSKYVETEKDLALKLVSERKARILVVCLDDESLEDADATLKEYNFAIGIHGTGAISRLIKLHLIQSKVYTNQSDRFFGRAQELVQLQRAVIDPERSEPCGVFVSGNEGIGRRTFLRKFISDTYGNLNTIIPSITVEYPDGNSEIYRKLLDVNGYSNKLDELKRKIDGFSNISDADQINAIANELKRISSNREALFLIDDGGIITPEGQFNKRFDNIMKAVGSVRSPILLIISRRRMPYIARRKAKSCVFIALSSLSFEDTQLLLAYKLRSRCINYTSESLKDLTELCDNHPFNVDLIVEYCADYGIESCIADPQDIVRWKINTGTAYLEKLELSKTQKYLVGCISLFDELDESLLIEICSDIDIDSVSDQLRRLLDLHLIEKTQTKYQVSPSLRVSVRLNRTFTLDREQVGKICQRVARFLSEIENDDFINISLIENSIQASLLAGTPVSPLIASFLLPSHKIWRAKRYYDDQDYISARKLAHEALDGDNNNNRLSHNGRVLAYRYMCLSQIRTSDTDSFWESIESLESVAKNKSDTGNVEFLKGFYYRFNGRPNKALEHFKEGIKYSPGNISLNREISQVLNSLERYGEAKEYASKALQQASDSPYILETLIHSTILEAREKGKQISPFELDDLFTRLKLADQSHNTTFYSHVSSVYELQFGDMNKSLELALDADQRTPNIFRVKKQLFDIYLQKKDFGKANSQIKFMQKMLDNTNRQHGKTELRKLIDCRVKYAISTGRYQNAEEQLSPNYFTDTEIQRYLRKIAAEKAEKKERE